MTESRWEVPQYVTMLRTWPDERVLRECRLEAFRASGPGGQKRNKTSSAVRLVHVPTGVSAIANESRSQAANRKSALRRLRHRLTIELREPIDGDTFTPPAWFEALHPGGRLDLSARSEHYLPSMGLVLDVLAANRWSVSAAARALGLSTGNLVRLLQGDEKFLAHVNEQRARAKLKPLGAR